MRDGAALLRRIHLTRMQSTGGKQARVPWLALCLLLFAGYFGLVHIDAPYILIDELLSFGNIGGFDPPYSPLQVLESLNRHSPDHVPLWYIFAALAAPVTGWSQAALRTVSVLTSLLMFALVYRFAAERFDRKTALVALFLLCTNEAVLYYMYRIRMYPLLMLLAVLHVWVYWRLLHHQRPSRLSWLVFVFSAAGLVYTHLFSVFLLLGLGINHLLFLTRSRRWWQILFAWALAGLLFLPYIPQILSGFSHNLKNNSQDSLLDVALRLVADLVNGPSKYWIWIPLLIALGYAIWKRPNRNFFAILRIGLIGCAGYLLLKLVLDETLITRIRYLFPLWFALIIPLAYALTAVPRWVLWLFLLAWCLGSYTDLQPRKIPPPSNSILHRPAALTPLRDLPPPIDAFIGAFDPSDPTHRRRHHGYSAADMYLRELGLRSETPNPVRDAQAIYDSLHEVQARFLLGTDPVKPPPYYADLLALISQDYVACAQFLDEPNMSVTQYADRALGCDHRMGPVSYDVQIRVLDRFARYLPEAQSLQALTWIETSPAELAQQYNVSWQLLTPDWGKLRQIDKHLHDSSVLPWSRIALPTDGLEPGDYRLVLILYRNDTGAKALYVDPETGQESGFLPLLDFTVAG